MRRPPVPAHTAVLPPAAAGQGEDHALGVLRCECAPQQARQVAPGQQYAEPAYTLAYSGASLLRPGVPELRQIKLYARGDGYRLRSSPDRGMLRELGEIGRWVNPRRAGTLKVWATIAGHRTNTIEMRVLPKRC